MRSPSLPGPIGICLALLLCSSFSQAKSDKTAPISSETEECLDCHGDATAGIVHDWLSSRHAQTTPATAMKKSKLQRRISVAKLPPKLANVAVGCFECHGLNPKKHKDNFLHEGHRINVVVSPADCKTCHPEEADQFAQSKKANAIANLTQNPVYHQLVKTATGAMTLTKKGLSQAAPTGATQGQTCFACHGKKIEVVGTHKVSTDDGDFEFPTLTNWPNQGIGRINPDGSRGACTACHPRHSFSIAIARKPETCGQCHLGPDVPAYVVYKESKHGNIYASKKADYNWDAVPWKVGKDFKAPTCATCHNALVTTPDSSVIAKRTHDFGSRLWVRIFGLIYAHPQPAHGATYKLRNPDGLPMPTTFAGANAKKGLISTKEADTRRSKMQKVCRGCHSSDWAKGHFRNLDKAVAETNKMTRVATQLVERAWKNKVADPSNRFDEPIEKMWVEQWLFYANSIRYAAAMGGPDYATFKNGWWQLTKNLKRMHVWLKDSKRTARPAR
jgi:hydroxylamine dehydrogenase